MAWQEHNIMGHKSANDGDGRQLKCTDHKLTFFGIAD